VGPGLPVWGLYGFTMTKSLLGDQLEIDEASEDPV
jgi:hypothetical protein